MTDGNYEECQTTRTMSPSQFFVTKAQIYL